MDEANSSLISLLNISLHDYNKKIILVCITKGGSIFGSSHAGLLITHYDIYKASLIVIVIKLLELD